MVFSAASPGPGGVDPIDQVPAYLLRNRTIRSFLGQHATRDWPEVVKLALLYGVVVLGKRALTSVEELRQALLSAHLAITAESAIPDVRQQLQQLQARLDEVTGDVLQPAVPQRPAPAYMPPPGARSPARTEAGYTVLTVPAGPHVQPAPQPARTLSPDRGRRRATSPPAGRGAAAAARASVGGGGERYPWRQGARSGSLGCGSQHELYPLPLGDWRSDTHRTWSPPGKKRSAIVDGEAPWLPDSAVYPAWWGDGSSGGAGGRGRGKAPPNAGRPDRPPPRLAYSVQPSQQAPIYKDDLVTAEYLDIPSSGYGQQQQHQQQHQRFEDPAGAWMQQPAAAGQQQPMFFLHPSGALVPVPQQQQGGPGGAAPPWFAMLQQANGGMGSGQQQQQQQQQPEGAGARATRPRDPRLAESRIRQQVRADRAAAKSRQHARQRAAAEVLDAGRNGGSGGDGAFSSPLPAAAAAAVAGVSPQSSASTPSQVADRLATNPWTSWTLSDGQDADLDLQGAAGGGGVGGGDMNVTLPGMPPGSGAAPAQEPSGWMLLPDSPGSLGHIPPAAGGGGGSWGGEVREAWEGAFEPGLEGGQEQGQRHQHTGRPKPVGWVVPIDVGPQQAGQLHGKGEAGGQGGSRGGNHGGQEDYGRVRVPLGVRPEVVRLSRAWVGDFGHLQEEPRFPRNKAFQHHASPAAAGGGSDEPAYLESMRQALGRLGVGGAALEVREQQGGGRVVDRPYPLPGSEGQRPTGDGRTQGVGTEAAVVGGFRGFEAEAGSRGWGGGQGGGSGSAGSGQGRGQAGVGGGGSVLGAGWGLPPDEGGAPRTGAGGFEAGGGGRPELYHLQRLRREAEEALGQPGVLQEAEQQWAAAAAAQAAQEAAAEAQGVTPGRWGETLFGSQQQQQQQQQQQLELSFGGDAAAAGPPSEPAARFVDDAFGRAALIAASAAVGAAAEAARQQQQQHQYQQQQQREWEWELQAAAAEQTVDLGPRASLTRSRGGSGSSQQPPLVAGPASSPGGGLFPAALSSMGGSPAPGGHPGTVGGTPLSSLASTVTTGTRPTPYTSFTPSAPLSAGASTLPTPITTATTPWSPTAGAPSTLPTPASAVPLPTTAAASSHAASAPWSPLSSGTGGDDDGTTSPFASPTGGYGGSPLSSLTAPSVAAMGGGVPATASSSSSAPLPELPQQRLSASALLYSPAWSSQQQQEDGGGRGQGQGVALHFMLQPTGSGSSQHGGRYPASSSLLPPPPPSSHRPTLPPAYQQQQQRRPPVQRQLSTGTAASSVVSLASVDSSSASSVATEDVLRLAIAVGGGYGTSDVSSQTSSDN